MMNLIAGNGQTGELFIDGTRIDPRPSQKLMNHSPDGFAWGYLGSGPAQAALAVMLHFAERIFSNRIGNVVDCMIFFDEKEESADIAFLGFDAKAYGVKTERDIAERVAVRLHQTFKSQVITGYPQGQSFSRSMDIVAWMLAQLKERAAKHDNVIIE